MPVIYSNGRICTLGPSGVVTQILVDDTGSVTAVGSQVTGHPLAAVATRYDLQGRTVLPGPMDSHDHLLWHARQNLTEADLVGSSSIDELLERLAAHAVRRPDGWLRGHGFDHERFPDRAIPTKNDLDRVAPNRPALISRVCEHLVVANSKALELAGVSSDNGILTEERMDPVYTLVPEPGADEWEEIAEHAMQLALRGGFTGVHCIVSSKAEIKALTRLRRSGRLPIRVRIQLRSDLTEFAKSLGLTTGFGDEWLSIGSAKLFIDGSMGAHTAMMSEPYADDPNELGELLYTPERLNELAKSAHDSGFQLAIHAIGDKGIDVALDAIEFAAGADAGSARHRIEHASILRPDQIDRFVRTGIIASVQPQFMVTDFWTVRRVGENRKGWIYPFASMWKSGVKMAGGTDSPVERLSSLEAIGRAVTRDAPWRGPEMSEGYNESECLTVEQAWRLFTEGTAYAGFNETILGTLEPGMRCDFIGLDADPFTVDPRTIETMQPTLSVTGGVVRWSATS